MQEKRGTGSRRGSERESTPQGGGVTFLETKEMREENPQQPSHFNRKLSDEKNAVERGL